MSLWREEGKGCEREGTVTSPGGGEGWGGGRRAGGSAHPHLHGPRDPQSREDTKKPGRGQCSRGMWVLAAALEGWNGSSVTIPASVSIAEARSVPDQRLVQLKERVTVTRGETLEPREGGQSEFCVIRALTQVLSKQRQLPFL